MEDLTLNELRLYPNPVQNSFELGYTLKEPQTICIHLLDSRGKEVYCFQKNQKENGTQTYLFSLPASVSSGIYTVPIHSANSTNNLQIIVK